MVWNKAVKLNSDEWTLRESNPEFTHAKGVVYRLPKGPKLCPNYSKILLKNSKRIKITAITNYLKVQVNTG